MWLNWKKNALKIQMRRSTGNETEEEPTIVVAEGAFDSLAAHMESEKAEWQYIKKLCQQEGELPIRIGNIKMAEPPEFHF